MCMACELLTGLDPEALSPPVGLPRYPVHFPDGAGGAALTAFYPSADEPGAAGRLRRVPAPRSNQHGRARGLRSIDAVHAFQQSKQAGQLGAGMRCVVAFPTPYTLLAGLDTGAYSPALLVAQERAVVAEINELLKLIPPEELTIQFDVCAETRIWESVSYTHLTLPTNREV